MFADALRGEARAAYRRQLHALLGIPEDATELQMHELVVAGFPAWYVADLYEQGGVPVGVRDWIISPGAFEVRVREEQRLTAEESDRFFRAVRIVTLAQSIFGEHEKALRWLSKPKERFAGAAPFAMLTTMPGMYAVEEMLLQTAEGLYA